MESTAARRSGDLASWDDDRGFGFITPAGGGARVFVHISDFGSGGTRPQVGDRLNYTIGESKDGKARAIGVRFASSSGERRPTKDTAGRGVASGSRKSARRNSASDSSASGRSGTSASSPVRQSRGRRGGSRISPQYLAIVAFAALYLYGYLTADTPLWLLVLYVVASCLAIGCYRADKSAAVAGRQRVPENTLLLIGVLGGWPGALIAQQVLRHKTQKVSFRIAFWGTVVINCAAFAAFVFLG